MLLLLLLLLFFSLVMATWHVMCVCVVLVPYILPLPHHLQTAVVVVTAGEKLRGG